MGTASHNAPFVPAAHSGIGYQSAIDRLISSDTAVMWWGGGCARPYKGRRTPYRVAMVSGTLGRDRGRDV